MARDRHNSKLRDLEGTNRQLVKRLKQAERSIARLLKEVERLKNTEPLTEEEVARDLEVENNNKIICGKCGAYMKLFEFGQKSLKKSYWVCSNRMCLNRKKAL